MHFIKAHDISLQFFFQFNSFPTRVVCEQSVLIWVQTVWNSSGQDVAASKNESVNV